MSLELSAVTIAFIGVPDTAVDGTLITSAGSVEELASAEIRLPTFGEPRPVTML